MPKLGGLSNYGCQSNVEFTNKWYIYQLYYTDLTSIWRRWEKSRLKLITFEVHLHVKITSNWLVKMKLILQYNINVNSVSKVRFTNYTDYIRRTTSNWFIGYFYFKTVELLCKLTDCQTTDMKSSVIWHRYLMGSFSFWRQIDYELT